MWCISVLSTKLNLIPKIITLLCALDPLWIFRLGKKVYYSVGISDVSE